MNQIPTLNTISLIVSIKIRYWISNLVIIKYKTNGTKHAKIEILC